MKPCSPSSAISSGHGSGSTTTGWAPLASKSLSLATAASPPPTTSAHAPAIFRNIGKGGASGGGECVTQYLFQSEMQEPQSVPAGKIEPMLVRAWLRMFWRKVNSPTEKHPHVAFASAGTGSPKGTPAQVGRTGRFCKTRAHAAMTKAANPLVYGPDLNKSRITPSPMTSCGPG